MKISASFLSSTNVPNDLIKLNLTSADYIHVDVMDGDFVKNKTMPFSEMKNIYKYTDKRLDVHLMCNNLDKVIPQYAELNTEYITIHVESESDVMESINLIKSFSIKAGIAISPNTKVSSLIPYLPYVDLVLVMGVEPGIGGQEFIPETVNRINEIRDLINEYDLNTLISVDGGINDDTAKLCNTDILVSGEYIIKSNDFEEKINSLR